MAASGRDARPALVLIPGHLCDETLYAPQAAAFADRVEIVYADTRADRDLGAMAERLLARAPERFAIAGLSMGGMIAMEVLARAPERVLGAALLDTDPTPARDKEKVWRAQMRETVRAQGLAGYVEPFVASFFRHSETAAARHAESVRETMLAAGEAVFEAQSDALDTRRDLRDVVARYPGPLAVLCGAEDRVCPPRLHEPLGLAANAELTLIPDCGHLATLEAPGAVNAAFDRWLGRWLDRRPR